MKARRRAGRAAVVAILGSLALLVLLAVPGRTFFTRRIVTDGATLLDDSAWDRAGRYTWREVAELDPLGPGDDRSPAFVPGSRDIVFARRTAASGYDLFRARWTPRGYGPAEPLLDLNTPHDETDPAFADGGLALVFTSNRPGGAGGFDLYVSEVTRGGFDAPVPFGPGINSPADERGPSFGEGGGRLVFASNRLAADGHRLDLFESVLAGGQFGAPRLLSTLSPSDAGENRDPALSSDGRTLIFASDREGGPGGFDLFRSVRVGSEWRPPELLSALSTPLDEGDPSLSEEGGWIAFSRSRGGDSPWTRSLHLAERRDLVALDRESGLYPGLIDALLAVLAAALLGFLAVQWRDLHPFVKFLLLSIIVHLLFLLFVHTRKAPGLPAGSGGERAFSVTLAAMPEENRPGRASAATGDRVAEPEPRHAPAAARPRAFEATAPPADESLPEERIASRDLPVRLREPRPEAGAAGAPPRSARAGPVAPDAPAATAIEPKHAADREPPRAAVSGAAAVPARRTPSAAGAESHARAIENLAAALDGRRPSSPGPPAGEPIARSPLIAPEPAPRVPVPAPSTGGNPAAALAATMAAGQTPPHGGPGAAPPRAVANAAARESGRRSTEYAHAHPQAIPAPSAPGAPAPAGPDRASPRPALPEDAPSGAGASRRAPVLATSLPVPAAAESRRSVAMGEREAPVPREAAPADSARIAASAGASAAPPDIARAPAASPTSGEPPAGAPARRPPPHGESERPGIGQISRTTHALRIPHTRAGRDSVPPAAGPRPGSAEDAERKPAVASDVSVPRRISGRPPGARTASLRLPGVAPPGERPLPPDYLRPRAPDFGEAATHAPSVYAHRRGPARSRALLEAGGSAETEAAVLAGLRYLKTRQLRDGSIGRAHRDPKFGDVEIGKTGLALLAFLGAGALHNESGEFQDTVRRGLEFLASSQDRDTGHFGNCSSYGHAIATYAFAEAYAMTGAPDLKAPLLRGIRRIIAAQTDRPGHVTDGGFGYYYREPDRTYDPWPRMSITVWQVMALESARIGGLHVPGETLAKAKAFVENSHDPRRKAIRYNHDPSWLRSTYDILPGSVSAGLFAMQLLGVDETGAAFRDALEFVRARPPRGPWRRPSTNDLVFRGLGNEYYLYYATLALRLLGGSDWAAWNSALKPLLLDSQDRDGSWRPISNYADYAKDSERDRVYTTAMCVLMLEAYYRYDTPLLKQLSGAIESGPAPAAAPAGIFVHSVDPGGNAEHMGIAPGDRIAAIGGVAVSTMEEVLQALNTQPREAAAPATLTLVRNGDMLVLPLSRPLSGLDIEVRAPYEDSVRKPGISGGG